MDIPAQKPKRKWLKYTLLSLLAVVVIAVGSFVWWGLTPLGPSADAQAALQSTDTVTVSKLDNNWMFVPKKITPTVGYVFYPGGHVDARSYAIYAREIAAQGYLVVIPEMPLSLAVFGIEQAKEIISSHPNITKWVVGGHSLGGSMAAIFAANNTATVSGLVLLASYPATTTDLSGTKLRVVSVYGTEDTVINRSNLESTKKLLPSTTEYSVLRVVIMHNLVRTACSQAIPHNLP